MCLVMKLVLQICLIAISIFLFLGFCYMIFFLVTLDHDRTDDGYYMDLFVGILFAITFLYLSLIGLHGAIKESRNSLNSFWSSMVCVIILSVIQLILAWIACENLPSNPDHWSKFVGCPGDPWGAPHGTYIKWILIILFATGSFIVSFLLYKEVRRTKDG